MKRTVYVFIVSENGLLWERFLQGRRNQRADLEGPFYVLGSPYRTLSPGKAVLASNEDFKEPANHPFVFTLQILSPSQQPLPNTTIDIWQASTVGEYYFKMYRLRGKCVTDADGKVEILTVAPGMYGPKGHERAGHFHLKISPPSTGIEGLTTQVYVCEGNNAKWLKTDFLNAIRKTRTQNILRAYSVPPSSPTTSETEPYMSFPPLQSTTIPMSTSLSTQESDTDHNKKQVDDHEKEEQKIKRLVESVKWWNEWLDEQCEEDAETTESREDRLKVWACGEDVLELNYV
ncbi:intradiol ring-cleavage dioxygenase family protein [Abortiporus biennis]